MLSCAMTEIMCRIGDSRKSGLIYNIGGEIRLVNGLFTTEQPSQCDGCLARKGRVRISGGDVIKNSEDEMAVGLGLVKLGEVEILNVVTNCEQI